MTLAVLSNQGGMTSFRYGGCNIRFRAPSILKRYVEVKEWDNGYIVVMSPSGEVLETSMDDVELSIVKGYWAKNSA